MLPNLWLRVGSSVAGYFLQVTAAYVVCLLLVRLNKVPQRRFWIWRALVIGAGTYWTYSLVTVFRPVTASAAHSGRTLGAMAPVSVSLPPSWSGAIATAGVAVAAVYGVFALALLVRVAWRHARLALLMRHTVEPPGCIAAVFTDMCRRFGAPDCELAVLPGIGSPATAGVWRPRILLPLECDRDHAALEDVLWHELAHVVRRDYVWATISDVICCLVFFHPAVFRARAAMRVERELACDLAVVRDRPGHRADYAECLTRFARARMLSDSAALGIDFAAAASILSLRVNTILAEPPAPQRGRTALHAIAGAALLAAFAWVSPGLTVLVRFAEVTLAPTAASLSQRVAARPAATSKPVHHPTTMTRTPAVVAEDGYPAAHRWSARIPVGDVSGNMRADEPDVMAAQPSTTAGLGEPTVVTPQVKAPSLGQVLTTIGVIAVGADRDDRRSGRFAPIGANHP